MNIVVSCGREKLKIGLKATVLFSCQSWILLIEDDKDARHVNYSAKDHKTLMG